LQQHLRAFGPSGGSRSDGLQQRRDSLLGQARAVRSIRDRSHDDSDRERDLRAPGGGALGGQKEMRIIAGTARGRRLLAPKSQAIRPTADRVREALFNLLGQSFGGIEVLDLFAGSGALALEALSRGARRAVMVDSDRSAIRLCGANAASLGFSERVRVIAAPVERAVK